MKRLGHYLLIIVIAILWSNGVVTIFDYQTPFYVFVSLLLWGVGLFALITLHEEYLQKKEIGKLK